MSFTVFNYLGTMLMFALLLPGCSGSQGFEDNSKRTPSKEQNASELNDGDDDQAIEPQQVAGAFLCEPVAVSEFSVNANQKGFGCGVYDPSLRKVNLEGYSFLLTLSSVNREAHNVSMQAAPPVSNYHTFAAFPANYQSYQDLLLQVAKDGRQSQYRLPVAHLGQFDIPVIAPSVSDMANTDFVNDDPNTFELMGSVTLGGNDLVQSTIVGGAYDGIPSDAIDAFCEAAYFKRSFQTSSSLTKEVGGLDFGFDSYSSTYLPVAKKVSITQCGYGKFEPFKKKFGDSKRLVQTLREGCYAVYLGLKSHIFISNKPTAKSELEQKILSYNQRCL